MHAPAQDHVQQERVVFISEAWYFRVRGGKVVGPYSTKHAAIDAVANYRDACMARLSLQTLWRPWRKPHSAAAHAEALRPADS